MGGAETSLVELLASVRAAQPGWELWLIAGEDGPLLKKAESLGVHVQVLPLPESLSRLGRAGVRDLRSAPKLVSAAAASLWYRRQLSRVLEEIQPGIVHSNGFKMHLLGAWTSPSDSAVVWHVHDYLGSRGGMRRLLQTNRRRCAAVIANSESVAADIRGAFGGSIPVQTIYNAVNLARFKPEGSAADLDALCGLNTGEPGIVKAGLVGTFARWKGHRVFLQALALLPESLPVRGYIIGGPIYKTGGSQWSMDELQSEASRLGLQGRVGFTGFVDDVPSAMRALDIVVHASTEPEPFGMVILEAMACGKAVIASRAGGARELFEEGETALGHECGDALKLSRQIERLVKDENFRFHMGRRARASVAGHFGHRRLGKELAEFYRRCCGEGQAASVMECSSAQ
jgi:glycosyltransferase involved in cell wall biosynthesis